jgi:hypothetical protein
MRLMALGYRGCPKVVLAIADVVGTAHARPATQSLFGFLACVSNESARRLVMAGLCGRCISWDEAALLALLDAAVKADTAEIARWMRRLGVVRPSDDLQENLARLAAALAEANASTAIAVPGVTVRSIPRALCVNS